MALERNWEAVPVTPFLVDLSEPGKITVNDTKGLYVGQKIVIRSDSDPTQNQEVKIKRIIGPDTVYVGNKGKGIADRFDFATFGTTGSLCAQEQPRPSISPNDSERSSHMEEPINAKRVINVDCYGNPIDFSDLGTGGGGSGTSNDFLQDGARTSFVDVDATTWTNLTPFPLTDRKFLAIENQSDVAVKLNFQNTEADFKGSLLDCGETKFYNISSDIALYAKSETGTVELVIEEIA